MPSRSPSLPSSFRLAGNSLAASFGRNPRQRQGTHRGLRILLPGAEKPLQPLLADPSLYVIPGQLAFGHATPLGPELPALQVLHAIQRAEDAQRLEGRKRVARVAFDVVF